MRPGLSSGAAQVIDKDLLRKNHAVILRNEVTKNLVNQENIEHY